MSARSLTMGGGLGLGSDFAAFTLVALGEGVSEAFPWSTSALCVSVATFDSGPAIAFFFLCRILTGRGLSPGISAKIVFFFTVRFALQGLRRN